MPEEQTPPPVAGQEPGSGTPQAGTPATPQAGTTTTPTTMTTDEAMAELKRVRAEAAAHRTKLAAFEKAQADAEAAKLSDKERLEKQLADLKTQHETATREARDRIIRYEVQLHAARLGIVDPDAAARLIDYATLELDEAGTPKNVEPVLRALIKARPWLAAPASEPAKPAPPATPQLAATNPARSTQFPAQITDSQYTDTRFRADFRRQHGIDVMTAVTSGKVQLIRG